MKVNADQCQYLPVPIPPNTIGVDIGIGSIGIVTSLVLYSTKEKQPIVKYENLFETIHECHQFVELLV